MCGENKDELRAVYLFLCFFLCVCLGINLFDETLSLCVHLRSALVAAIKALTLIIVSYVRCRY